jgi:hypothetical protein
MLFAEADKHASSLSWKLADENWSEQVDGFAIIVLS